MQIAMIAVSAPAGGSKRGVGAAYGGDERPIALDACAKLDFTASELAAIDKNAVDLGVNRWTASSDAAPM